ERAPTALELFAHGAHDAPGTFEIGNPGLKIETANTAELGLKRIDGAFRFDAKVYYTKYDNFIFRQATGILCGEDFASCGTGTEFIQTVYAQRDAVFRGGEMAWQWDLLPVATGIFGVDGQYDFVRATFTDGSNVPRMPPMRVGGGTYWRNDSWFVRMGLLHAFGQSDLGVNDTPTAGYNLLKMEISNKQYWRDSPWGTAEITTGLVGDNLLDVDVRNSVQFHKDEILMPGRSIKFFMNAKFGGVPPVKKGGYYKAPTGFGASLFKAPVRTAWSWAGFYVGGSIGYGRGKSNTDTVFSDPATAGQLFATDGSRKLEGAIGGAQGGYNWVAGNLLAGVEADLNYSGQRARMRAGCPGEVCNAALVGIVGDPSVLAISEQGQKLEWFATLRGRLGATVTARALAYVTGGLAVGEIMTAGIVFGFDGDGNPVNTIVSSHNTKAGWTVGGGIEGRLAGNWTARLEYLYLDLGTVSTVPTPAANATVATAFNSRVTDNVVRMGLNYKFDTLAGIWAGD
ncbi:MAG TPA: TonB-dependent receptor, partial [Xanthobacteraceae bacterium]|nr:TonB-dependent receptor [Xanthobacteraceae bacterium]